MDLFAVEPTADPLPPLSSTAETATELIRPALCVQAREGRLNIFLPYASKLADYLDLVAAVEDTCQHLRRPVWVEGYTPPADPRLAIVQRHPGSRGSRGESAARQRMGRVGADSTRCCLRRRAKPADRGEVQL